jgi:uncharacterized membrane protein
MMPQMKDSGRHRIAVRTDLRRIVGRLLLGGVVLSGVLLAAGLAMGMRDGEGPERFATLREMLRAALEGNGAAIIGWGLLVLMATPILRVMVLAAGWAMEGNTRFAAIAVGVLVMLGVSMSLGLR